MRAIPLYVSAGCGVLLAACGTWIICHHPKGTQPSTWGHLQMIADLVDDWGAEDDFIHVSGDKGFNDNGTRHPGTSSSRGNVGSIEQNMIYE